MKRTVIWALALAGFCSSVCGQDAARIQGNPTGFPTVQDAINAAVDGDLVMVRGGSHLETLMVSNRDVSIEGGYNVTFTDRTDPDSVVDAQKVGTTLWVMDSSTRVDRVHFTGGVGWLGNLFVGGGVLLHRSWVEFADCHIYSNTASWGGGLFVGTFSYAKMINACQVYSNLAVYSGGGCFVDGRLDIVHSNVIVYANTAAEGHGGGIWVETGYLRLFQGRVNENVAQPGGAGVTSAGGGIGAAGSYIEMGDNAFLSQNEAQVGGGMALLNSTGYLGRARLADCSFINNQANDSGGGLYASNSLLLFKGANFWGNHCATNGGGVWMYSSSADCNTNGLLVWQGAAGEHGGGIYMQNSTGLFNRLICGDIFGGNLAGGNGGGLYALDSWLQVAGGGFFNNGADNPVGYPNGAGGGMALNHSVLIVTNGIDYQDEWTVPVFANNHAGTNVGHGGAIWLGSGSTADVYAAVFTNNSAYRGGALFTETDSLLRLNFTELRNNLAWYDGGAMYLDSLGAVVGLCLFEANRCGHDGGAIYVHQAFVDVANSRLIGNVASNRGGAVFGDAGNIALYAGAPYYSVTNGWPMLLQSNVAVNGAGGAGSMTYGNAVIYNAAALENNATAYASGFEVVGGSIRIGNTLIAGGLPDFGPSGAGLSLAASATGRLFATTIADNNGDGLRLYACSLNMTNCIVWGNRAEEISTNDAAGSPIDIAYSDIRYGWPGTGNIDAEPGFYPNYHLRHNSPCIDIGAPLSGGFVLDYYDIDGEVRTNTVCDMGFDEFTDSDHDRFPDVVETFTGTYVDELNTGTNPQDPDSDGDSVNDGDEWVADTNPTRGNDYLRIVSVTPGTFPDEVDLVWEGGTQAAQEIDVTDQLGGTWQTNVQTFLPPTPRTNKTSVIFPVDTNWSFRIRAYRL